MENEVIRLIQMPSLGVYLQEDLGPFLTKGMPLYAPFNKKCLEVAVEDDL